jgi:hypothetical protein
MICVAFSKAIEASLRVFARPVFLLKTRITILIITPNELPQNRQLALA